MATERKYKVIVVGDSGVGKTALTYRFCEGLYCDNLRVTVGVDLRVKEVEVDNEIIKLIVWDTAGLERNRWALSSHYYRNVNAVILVYDVSNIQSFNNLPVWLKEVAAQTSNDVIKVLVGNKSDEAALVYRQTAQQFADTHGLPLFETSAKLDSEKDNIEGIFLTIAHKLKANRNLAVAQTLPLLSIEGVPTQSSSCCLSS